MMKAAQSTPKLLQRCKNSTWTCISEKTIPVPRPQAGSMLVAIKGASVNPIDVDLVETGISRGTLGMDGAGVVAAVNACENFKVGDEVWTVGLKSGSYAEYAIIPCSAAGLKPKALNFADAGTIPMVGATSLRCLKDGLGLPLTNLTVVVTSGQGGTGFIGIQLAKAMGASKVVTAATGAGIDVMKKLGADIVIDYHKQELFDALEDNSVDVVYDNFGLPGTADKAMHAIRKGGVFMILPGGNKGQPSAHPKQGVRQVANCRTKNLDPEALNVLAQLFDAGKLLPHTMSPTYGLAEVPQAFTRLLSPGVIGKIAITPTTTTVV